MKTRRRGIILSGDPKGLIGLRTPEAIAVKGGEHEFGRMVGEKERERVRSFFIRISCHINCLLERKGEK